MDEKHVDREASSGEEKIVKNEYHETLGTADNEQQTPEVLEFKKKEARLVKKLDCFVVPVVFLLQLISYLDRGNIGFAATQGMIEDINLRGADLNIAVSIFYITYILAEFPASMYVKRLQFNRVIPAITFGWGLIFLLGAFEGCLFPSLTLFIANWYKREELGLRISYLFVASALSGAVGGLIALGILYMDGVSGVAGWRWLYIVEGIITMVFAGMTIFLVPGHWSTAYFLNDSDKAIMRVREEAMAAYSGGTGHYTKADIMAAAKDITTWVHAPTQIAMVTILYGFGTFLPVILKFGFGFSTLQTQYLVVPVFFWGSVAYFIGALVGDKYNARFWGVIILAPVGIAGYAILLRYDDISPGVSYFATFLISTACYLCTGTNIAWLGMNRAPDGKRAASMGILLTFTNLGGIISGQIYRSDAAPRYTLGQAWSAGSLAFGWCGFWVLRTLYKRREKQKAEARAQGWQLGPDELWTDRAPDFKYQF
ncbi:hypothetical protein LTR37_013692 [Vermiconidia calcicola]|uniref:Uncharacterized protein n=1 Tax=Vermiconidia calcicola TaxID=1690605 RepID=A0ACC3MWD3_9PEZI|nr:hypothetical protein LTR37_013692 [Vermiconidia calcicola]